MEDAQFLRSPYTEERDREGQKEGPCAEEWDRENPLIKDRSVASILQLPKRKVFYFRMEEVYDTQKLIAP